VKPRDQPLARKIITIGLVLVVTIVSQSFVHNCNSAGLASDNDTASLITAINKSEVGLRDDYGPSALNLARFYASNYRVIDDKSQRVLLSTLGVTHVKNEKAASELRSLTASMLFRNRGCDGLIVKDAVWTYERNSPLANRTGAEHLCTKDTREQQIDAWLKTNTHGMIQTGQNDLNDSYHTINDEVFATSVYANLKWTKPFSVSETQPENFFTEAGWCDSDPPGKAQTMHCHGVFDFFSDDEIKAVKFPCRETNSPTSLDVVLVVPAKGPGCIHDLQVFLSDWDSLKWQKWLRSFHPVPLDLAVPKFHRSDSMQEKHMWPYMLQGIIPPQGRRSIGFLMAKHDAIFDEQGFRFAEGDEYYLSRDQRLRCIPIPSLPHYGGGNSPPGLTYLYYHPKPGMIIDQPFMVLVFDKKTNALVYMTIGNGPYSI
jgi:hypothetical protein